MPLLLQLHRHPLATLRTELLNFEILPTHPLAVLLVQPNGPDAVARLGAEHAEDCALTAWHKARVLYLSFRGNARGSEHRIYACDPSD